MGGKGSFPEHVSADLQLVAASLGVLGLSHQGPVAHSTYIQRVQKNVYTF